MIAREGGREGGLRSVRGALAIALAAVASLACGGAPCPRVPHTSVGTALHHLASMRRHAVRLRAEARVDQRGPEGRVRGTVYMMIARPDRVRFDAMTQFGPAAVLTSDGSSFALADLREGRYYEGPSCGANIARLLGVPLSGDEVARLLLGDTPRIPAMTEALTCTGDGTYLLVLGASDGRRQEIELGVRDDDRSRPPDAQRLRLIRTELYRADGRTEWRVRYEDYRVVPDPESGEDPRLGLAMAHEIRFEHPGIGADTLVRFEDLTLNVALPDEAFRQTPPPGVVVESMPCE